MAMYGDRWPDWAVTLLWLVSAALIALRALLLKLPLLGALVDALYAPAQHPEEHNDPAAYREAMLRLEAKLSRKLRVSVKHQYVQVRPDVYLHAATAGDASKPMMLFLHGFPEFWYTWRYLIEAFADEYYCVALDQRGYNISSKPRGLYAYAGQELVDDVEMVVKKLSGGRKIVLVAHDWGGAVAWQVAHCCDFVEKFVALNIPHPTVFKKALQSSANQRRLSIYMLLFQIPFLGERLLGGNGARAVGRLIGKDLKNSAQKEKHDADAFAQAANQPGALTGALNWYRASMTGPMRKWRRKQIDVPVLYIYGKDDVAFDNKLAIDEAAHSRYAKDLTIVELENCSHWTANDRPAEVIGLMKKFL